MKRTMLLVIAVLILTSSPTFALVTTQSWDFSSATYNASLDGGVWLSGASTYSNTNTVPLFGTPTAVVKLGDGGSYDDTAGTFTNVDWVQLWIGNYDNQNPVKTVDLWANYTPTGSLGDISIENSQETIQVFELYRIDTSTNTHAKYEVYPNPSWEVITLDFDIPVGAANTLYSISVSTDCIPAPGALLLTGFGAGLVNWMRRRRTI